jgi:hypothetical protein
MSEDRDQSTEQQDAPEAEENDVEAHHHGHKDSEREHHGHKDSEREHHGHKDS